MWSLLSLIIAAATVWSPVPEAPVAHREGSITGRVTLVAKPPRRSASRYPGQATGSHPLQTIPAVAYLEGRAGTAAAPRGPLAMAQRDTAFAPSMLVVPRGSRVSFPNEDPFFHNVFSYSSTERFDLGRYPRGDAKSVTFDEAGVVNVYCEVHEFMRSAVVVVDNPHWAVVADDGSFTIGEVPAGEYTLVVWHADLGTRRERVRVVDGVPTRVSLRLGG